MNVCGAHFLDGVDAEGKMIIKSNIIEFVLSFYSISLRLIQLER